MTLRVVCDASGCDRERREMAGWFAVVVHGEGDRHACSTRCLLAVASELNGETSTDRQGGRE